MFILAGAGGTPTPPWSTHGNVMVAIQWNKDSDWRHWLTNQANIDFLPQVSQRWCYLEWLSPWRSKLLISFYPHCYVIAVHFLPWALPEAVVRKCRPCTMSKCGSEDCRSPHGITTILFDLDNTLIATREADAAACLQVGYAVFLGMAVLCYPTPMPDVGLLFYIHYFYKNIGALWIYSWF